MTTKLALAATLALAGFAGSAQAGFSFDDPSNVLTATVASDVSAASVNNVGNISLASFNALTSKWVHTIDSSEMDSGNGNWSVESYFTLTNATSGTDTDIAIQAFGGGFALQTGGGLGTYATTDNGYLATSRANVTMTFSEAVGIVGFTINRLKAATTIELFDESDTSLGTWNPAHHTIDNILNFFGYESDSLNIKKISITTSAGNQWGIDDISFSNAIPEPASAMLVGLGALALIRRK
ncbi:PEP-CTERM sorting domain-containing protein [Poriferisphaera sp. WC338]|uniref:PEP-CTERM sorting domain-containing protein n=1 Tax=Poriferisphaera sp. WC338 TaxID=3425129 RepID=UPI003D81299E